MEAVTEEVSPKPEQPQKDENYYKAKLEHHESTTNYGAINPDSGACGILQALPCSKLPCVLTDRECQDRWFKNYMVERYGSWEAAYNYWHCIGECTNNYGTITKTDNWW